MKRFVLNIISYVLAVAAVIALANAAWVAYSDKSVEKILPDRWYHIPEKIDICNFGSSHGEAGFCYDAFEDNYSCFNFAMSGQTLSYDMRLMVNYQTHMDDGGVAFIVVSYHTPFGAPETDEPEFASKNQRYYEILPADLIKDYSQKNNIFLEKIPVLAGYENVLASIFRDLGLLGDTNNDGSEADTEPGHNDQLVNGAAQYYYDYVVENKKDAIGNRIYNREEIDAIYSMIEICKNRNVTPILVTVPLYSALTDIIHEKNPDFYDDFYGLIGQICADTGVKYFDYAEDERISNDPALFQNAGHLNHTGAKKFTAIVLEEAAGIALSSEAYAPQE